MTIAPRDDLALVEGYHSPQVDVRVRLNTNESPAPPPAAWRDALAAELSRVEWHRYPDRAATELRAAIADLHGVGQFVIDTSTFTHTTASGNLQITGLPFTPKTLTNSFYIGPIQYNGYTSATHPQVVCRMTSNSATISIVKSGSGQPVAFVAATDMPTGGDVILIGSITFEAA